MAYIKKYSFPFATKFEQDAVIELWEDTTDTTVYEFQGISFQIQYIPSSDDPFEAIYATQLAIVLDVTDDATGNTSAFIPNLITLNDKKYQAKLIIDGANIYTGWTLSDSVSLSFSTGRKELSFNCVDGLAMLKDIEFSNGVLFNNNNPTSLITFISGCLSQIGFPSGLDIVTSVTYFAQGMNDKSDGLQYEPFAQTYIFANSFIKSDGSIESCYVVLDEILKSFGARIIQSKNKWQIYSINQFAQNTRYEVDYNSSGVNTSAGTNALKVEIQPYVANTSNLYFINNSQTKLLKKGYNNIISNNDIVYPSNLMFNGSLKYLTAGFPTGWVAQVTGSGVVTVEDYTFLAGNAFQLRAEITTGTAAVLSTSLIYIANKDEIKLSFTVNFWNFTTTSAAKLILIISSPTQDYYLNNTSNWIPLSVSPNYYEIPESEFPADALEAPKDYSFTAPPVPFGGQLQFGIQVTNTVGINLLVSNFKLSATSLFKNVYIKSALTDSDAYTLEINSPLGVASNVADYYNYKGYLMLADGSPALNWYRYEYPIETFRGLAQLLVRQYMNIYQKNIINLDCDLSSMNTNQGLLNGVLPIKIGTDTDPASINIEDKFYMFGNTTIDLYADTIQSTLLQINNVNVEGATIVTTYDNAQEGEPLPTDCFCYEVYGTENAASFTYTDCNGIDNFMYIALNEGMYIAALSMPSCSGCTATLVSSSFCSI